MKKSTSVELQLHFALLERHEIRFDLVLELYGKHLLGCLRQWYGPLIEDDESLAHEAVYNALHTYYEQPRGYIADHGSLKSYLEINADRAMQAIFDRERLAVGHNHVDHRLALLFDNEKDILLAKLVLRESDAMLPFVELLDLGSYRIADQISEVKRQTNRIKKTLASSQLSFIPSPKAGSRSRNKIAEAPGS